MASWDSNEMNNPHLYTPRNHPKVHKVPEPVIPLEGQPLPPPEEPLEAEEFVFDEDPAFARPLADIAIVAPGKGRGRAPVGQGRQAKGQSREKGPARGKNGDEPGMGASRAVPPAGRKEKRAHQSKPIRPVGGNPLVYAGVIVGCAICLMFIVVMMMPQVAGYFWKDWGNYAFVNGTLLRYDKEAVSTYKQHREYMQRDTIFPGVFVDGVHLGDMTQEEARQALTGSGAEGASPFSVTVAIGNKTWVFDNKNVSAARSLGNVVQQAYALGRTNTTEILGTGITPFQQRVDAALALRENVVSLQAGVTYDQAAVRAQVEDIAAYVTRKPVDAQIQSFDFNTRTFAYTDEQVGVTIDGEALYQQVFAALERGAAAETLVVEPILAQPTVTKAQLQATFRLVSAYTTDTTNEANRNNNISLACRALNGTVLLPGETFSFNEKTGQRTIDKGYREAGAIAGGQSIEEVGGGICQVSSTLFNAVARADLDIVSRSPHAWPSTYVNWGEDATVNWPDLDFTFKNNRDTPVFVIAYYKDRKVSAEIWGVTLGEGITIDLKSEVVNTMQPSGQVNYVFNASLPYGTQKETVKARTGYVVDTYKVWYQNGAEIKREKLHSSTYKAYQQTVEYNE